ncbi:DUF421 domain-containing protein [Clostridium uliginosum]|uniref:Uncharacterized membrane protein YcaP, DUF421 family n=1 Tax=Clostridium uliginosum TaxID=119641 RepID=A0A1I1MKR2_9CLOT|nr:DUF421 domain-containing protein [Clostridium uliginosum]SFC85412.1 Uncharacterized membrane protein YcaP, DUF421 family [Clostridium uliginosum]
MNEGIIVLVRAIFAFFSLLIFTRILGKKQISQLTPFDYVLGITIGSIAATLTTDLSSAAWTHWIGLLAWVVLGLGIDLLTTKSRYMAKHIEGEPSIIIINGKILEDTMRKLKYNATNLQHQLRCKDIFDISEVQFAVLETNGELSVLKKSDLQPLTPKNMNIPVPKARIGLDLIYDGIVVDTNLKQINRDRKWLKYQLKKYGVDDPSEVFLATYTGSGSLYVDKFKDKIHKQIVVSEF